MIGCWIDPGGLATSFIGSFERRLDAPDAHVVKVEPVAVARLKRFDEQMVCRDCLKLLISCLVIHGCDLPLLELVLALLGDLHDLDGHRDHARPRARHRDRRDGDGST